MKTVKPMNKSFIAKMLVLCMIVSLLPTMALAAEPNGDNSSYYSINADVTGTGSGKVDVTYYVVGSDTAITKSLNSTYYDIKGDVTEIQVTVTPDNGSELTSATYQIGNGNPVSMNLSSAGGNFVIPASAPAKIHIAAVFTKTTSPSTGGGTTTADTVTDVSDATTGEESSVVEIDANARVSNGVATASVNDRHLNEAVNKALAAAEKNDTAPEIDIVVDTKDAKGLKLTLGTDAMDKLSGNPAAVLKVISDAASLKFDANAIAALGDQATGDIVISVAPATGLTDEQKEAVGDAAVYDVEITANGKQITDFYTGTVSIGLPYTLAEGQEAADVKVYHLDGTDLLGRTTTYADGIATFTTDHLSLYVIGDVSMSKALTDAPDVMSGEWYAEAVKYVYGNKLMNGTPTGFDPDGVTTRAMVVTTLYRLASSPEVTGESKFEDVEADQWYTDAVIWAAETGVVKGTSDTTFEPEKKITRQEIATMLYRYADLVAKKSVSRTSDITDFIDHEEVSDWALDAVKWANAEGLIKGVSTTELKLAPGDTLTRAALATFLMRFDKNIVK